MRLAATLLVVLFLCASCRDDELRGSVAPSSDGKTYLVVADGNGGKCGPLTVDGRLWTHALGDASPIEPGSHVIVCGAQIPFTISQGTVYTFDYWGP